MKQLCTYQWHNGWNVVLEASTVRGGVPYNLGSKFTHNSDVQEGTQGRDQLKGNPKNMKQLCTYQWHNGWNVVLEASTVRGGVPYNLESNFTHNSAVQEGSQGEGQLKGNPKKLCTYQWHKYGRNVVLEVSMLALEILADLIFPLLMM